MKIIKDLISVIIPIYNSERWLERCIMSVTNQTYRNLEIILVNDGSSDKSLEICEKFKKSDNRIVLINKENEGVSKARNDGLKLSNGRYIMFVDSDDWIEHDMCEILINTIKNEEVDLVLCGLNVYQNENLLRTPHIEERKIELFSSIEEYFVCRTINCGPCNKIFIRDKITSDFDNTIKKAEDLLFNIEYLKNVKNVYSVSKCLYNVCLDNENSLNRKISLTKIEGTSYTSIKEIEFLENFYNDYKKIEFFRRSVKNDLAAQIYMLQNECCVNEFKDNCKKLQSNKYVMKIILFDNKVKQYIHILFMLFLKRKYNILFIYCKFLNMIKKLFYKFKFIFKKVGK